MVMGANIGTSVTNTLVSMAQVGDRSEFERAFACAVHHDIFNWLTVAVFLPLEVLTGYLYRLTGAMVSGIRLDSGGQKPPELLHALTFPVIHLVVHLDEEVLVGWSVGDTRYDNATTLLKAECQREIGAEPPSPIIGANNKVQARAISSISFLLSLNYLLSMLPLMLPKI